MEEKLQQRLETLKNEYLTGQKKLMELDAQSQTLKETLLRISGAIQVLEEEIQSNVNNNAEAPGAESSAVGSKDSK